MQLWPNRPKKPGLKLRFADKGHFIKIIGYGNQFPVHPRQFVFGKNGEYVMLTENQDPFTGVDKEELRRRKAEVQVDQGRRRSILRHVLIHGSPWETPNAELIAKVSKKYANKRLGAKAAKAVEKLADVGELLDAEQSTTYRALAARANYLALDRPDIGYATKELCRQFQSPTKNSVEQLKRLVRFLVGCPRLVWHYPFQTSPHAIDVFVDTDFGGCQTTRRSTSGGIIMHGKHTVKHWSTTQTTVSLSSAEAELSGICKGAAQGLGMQALAADLGFKWKIRVGTDAAAAIGICRRRGLGKIRHLATADLWVQDRIKKKDFDLIKVPGASNPSDVLTKHVDRSLLDRHLEAMNLSFVAGRATSAPKIS